MNSSSNSLKLNYRYEGWPVLYWIFLLMEPNRFWICLLWKLFNYCCAWKRREEWIVLCLLRESWKSDLPHDAGYWSLKPRYLSLFQQEMHSTGSEREQCWVFFFFSLFLFLFFKLRLRWIWAHIFALKLLFSFFYIFFLLSGCFSDFVSLG